MIDADINTFFNQLNEKIIVPGSGEQLKHLINTEKVEKKDILVVGSGCEEISSFFYLKEANSVQIIVEDQDSLIASRIKLKNDINLTVRLMEFSQTDFAKETFDIVFAQASISNFNRKNIVREIIRILKPYGLLNVGELIILDNNVPAFVKETWEAGDIQPLKVAEVNNYYISRNFILIDEKDFSGTLKHYYEKSKKLLNEKLAQLSPEEKSFYKKMINRINHESSVYLKLGGHKFMGFKSLILRKQN